MKQRIKNYPILDLFIDRWSARSFLSDPLDDNTLMTLFEAGRWAPSSFNNQPWRFIYSHKGCVRYDEVMQAIDAGNRSWAEHAPVVVTVLAHRYFEQMPDIESRSHMFDTGAACQNIALQAQALGLVVHLVEGFDQKAVQKIYQVSESYTICVIMLIGKVGPREQLPEKLQAREYPSQRKELDQIVFRDSLKTD